MAEYQHFDGETYITFNIVYATEKEVRLAITNRGKISVLTYDLSYTFTYKSIRPFFNHIFFIIFLMSSKGIIICI